MAIRVKSLDELSSDLTQQNQAFMSELLNAAYPQLDTNRGVIHDLICFLSGGLIAGVSKTELDRAYDSRSLLAVASNPELFDADILDHILSNFLLTRTSASSAAGTITVVVSDNVTTVIPSDLQWSVGSLLVSTLYPVVARTYGSDIISTNDRPLIARGDGTYEFTVPVVAVEPGISSNLKANSGAVPGSPVPRFVKAYVSADFVGGRDVETVPDLLAKIAKSVPAKVAAGGDNLTRVLAVESGFTHADFSVVGFGSTSQLRDKRTPFPVSSGGRVDVYARTSPSLVSATKSKLCQLVVLEDTTATWQTVISRADYPGHYRVASVVDPKLTSGGIDGPSIVSYTRTYDQTAAEAAHDVQSAAEAFLSVYQSGLLTFKQTVPANSLAIGATAIFDVLLEGQPGIDTLQQIADSPEHRCWNSDVLLKAAVPANVFVDLIVSQSSVALSDTDKANIQAAAANAAGVAGFPGRLYVSAVIQAAVAKLPAGVSLRSATVFAKVLQNDGTTFALTGDQILQIPTLPDKGVAPATTSFFSHATNVTVASSGN